MLSNSARIRRTEADNTDVVIIGAGLAGLAAAHHLTSAGLDVIVLEATPRLGGRMTTEQLDGYRLDHGTGLLTADWPDPARLPDLGLGHALTLRHFAPGALLRSGDRLLRVGDLRLAPARTGRAGGHHISRGPRGTRGTRGARGPRGPRGALSTARALTSARSRAAMVDALDLARLRAGLARLANTAPERLRTRSEAPATVALSARGLPGRTLDALVRPLLSALLSDPELTTSSRVADLGLRGFARAGLCLPAGGASTLPELLAAGLPEGSVRTGVRATSVAANAVRTDTPATLTCRAVLIATGARDAAELLPGLRVPGYHPVTVLHHAAPEPPTADPSLLVDADRRGPVSHTWVATAVDPSRAEPGRTMVTSVVLGPAAAHPTVPLEKAARAQLAGLYGVSTERWELLRAHHDPQAVPAMPAPHDARRPVRVLCGLYVCGDHRDTAGAQGALVSARRAGTEVLRDFGLLSRVDDGPGLSAVA